MRHNCYGLYFSVVANHSANCRKFYKVSSLFQVCNSQKQGCAVSFIKRISSYSFCSSTDASLLKRFRCNLVPKFVCSPLRDSALLLPEISNKFLRMSSTKRLLEEGSLPPHKYRLLHSNAAETEVDPSKIPSSNNNLECERETSENNDQKQESSINTGEKKLNFRKLKKYEKEEIIRFQAKASLQEYDTLIQGNGLLEQINSKDTTFGAKEKIVSGDAATAENYHIDPKPLIDDSEDLADGMWNPKKKKKMFAVMLSYSGKGFLGLQNNPPHRTIEGELLKAMHSMDLLTEAECLKLQVVNFQRAARTDKGVSAAKQVISVRLPIAEGDEEKVKQDLNALLPPQICIMDIRRATRSFNSKNWCDCRTYSYLAPSFAFAPLDQVTSTEFRISEAGLAELRRLMAKYLGTHNFHNFTIRKKPTDANAKRFIQLVEVEDPFVRQDVEWILFKIRGQSFMMHQIRKMIGLVMSICRGLIPASVLDESFTHAKIETPKAPGLGLVLEQPHYDIYNKRFGQDGTHKPIDWSTLEDEVARFRRDYIDEDIITTELQEKSMLEFLKILHMYSFIEDTTGSGIARAHRLVTNSDGAASEDAEEDQLPAEDDDQDENMDASDREETKKSSVNNRGAEATSNGNHEGTDSPLQHTVPASGTEEGITVTPDAEAANVDATCR